MERKRLTDSIKTAKAWAKVHLKEPIINSGTGFLIEVSQAGLEHSLRHDLSADKSGRFIDLLALIRKFKTILRDAQLIETRKDKYEIDETLLVHEFQCEIKIKGKNEIVEIIVKEFTEGKKVTTLKRIFYNHRILANEIKKP